jgi:hypothetical protein
MPLGDAYDKLIESPIADMKNVGAREGGSITAATFLQRFVEEGVKWAHLDIAGMVWADKPGTSGTRARPATASPCSTASSPTISRGDLVDFYHLTASPLERVLPRICEKVLREGERLLVVADEEPLLASSTSSSGPMRPTASCRTGRSDGPAKPADPAFAHAGALNGARNIALADGVWREEALGFDRAFYFFDSAILDRRADPGGR